LSISISTGVYIPVQRPYHPLRNLYCLPSRGNNIPIYLHSLRVFFPLFAFIYSSLISIFPLSLLFLPFSFKFSRFLRSPFHIFLPRYH
jgi:hypothetical protein